MAAAWLWAPAGEAPTRRPLSVEHGVEPGAAAAPRWVAIGGGPTPDSNEVSIEQDLVLARDVLGPGGALLFAGGPGSRAVQIQDRPDAPPADALLADLAFLFAPRNGRDARYRRTVLEPQGPATANRALQLIIDAAAGPAPPLLVLLAGHGDRGDAPADNVFALWSHTALTPVDIAAGLDTVAEPRQVRLVVSTCHSGGFQEVLFRGGAGGDGVTDHDRCGLFSTTWDRQASGCSPALDRRLHEGFNKIFFHALAHRDEHGRALPLEVLDLDRDGVVTLLEAHARVRMTSTAIDVPTTTSERWLRELAPPQLAGEVAVELPVERAVINALQERTGATDIRTTIRKLEPIQQRLLSLERVLTDAAAEETRWFDDTAGELLTRWPVLDDPWHPDFALTLSTERDAIRVYLDASAAYASFRAASAAADQLDAELSGLERREAPLLRLERARDTVRLARRLAARGGHGWQVFERLRACETTPP